MKRKNYLWFILGRVTLALVSFTALVYCFGYLIEHIHVHISFN